MAPERPRDWGCIPSLEHPNESAVAGDVDAVFDTPLFVCDDTGRDGGNFPQESSVFTYPSVFPRIPPPHFAAPDEARPEGSQSDANRRHAQHELPSEIPSLQARYLWCYIEWGLDANLPEKSGWVPLINSGRT